MNGENPSGRACAQTPICADKVPNAEDGIGRQGLGHIERQNGQNRLVGGGGERALASSAWELLPQLLECGHGGGRERPEAGLGAGQEARHRAATNRKPGEAPWPWQRGILFVIDLLYYDTKYNTRRYANHSFISPIPY